MGEKEIRVENRGVFKISFWEKRETKILEFEGSHSGHVWKILGAINS
jgi:hypothetical protein